MKVKNQERGRISKEAGLEREMIRRKEELVKRKNKKEERQE